MVEMTTTNTDLLIVRLEASKRYTYEPAKRALDIVCACLALIVLSPLLLAVSLAIYLSDRGPVVFSQTRIGKNGRPFKFYKFRSMVVNAEELKAKLMEFNQHTDDRTFKLKRDPRITRVGSFIRRTSIDELPQLLNILVGDMSVVGPRPAVPQEVAKYSSHDRRRLAVRPGLTCIWQVSGRSEIPFPGQVKMDIEYIKNRSLMLDMALIAKTIPAVLTSKGAY